MVRVVSDNVEDEEEEEEGRWRFSTVIKQFSGAN